VIRKRDTKKAIKVFLSEDFKMLVIHFLVAFIFLAYYAIWGWLLGNYIGLVYRVCQNVHYRCAVAARLGAHFTFREIFSLVTTALGQEWSRFVDSDPIMGFLNNGQGLVLNRVGYSVVDNLRWYVFANFPFLFEMVAQPIVRAFSPTPLPKPQHTHFSFRQMRNLLCTYLAVGRILTRICPPG